MYFCRIRLQSNNTMIVISNHHLKAWFSVGPIFFELKRFIVMYFIVIFWWMLLLYSLQKEMKQCCSILHTQSQLMVTISLFGMS